MAVQPVLDERAQVRIVVDTVPDQIRVYGASSTASVTGGGAEAAWITAESGELCITGPIRCAPLPDRMAPRVLRSLDSERVRLEDRHDAIWSDGSWKIETLEPTVLEHEGRQFSMAPKLGDTRFGLESGTRFWLAVRGEERRAAELPAATTWVGWQGKALLHAGRCLGVWGGERLPVCTGRTPFPVGDAWGVGVGDTVAIVRADQIRFVGTSSGALLAPAQSPLESKSCNGEPQLTVDGWFVVPTPTGAIATPKCPTNTGVWKRYRSCEGTLHPLGGGRAACERTDGNGARFLTLGRY